MFHHGNVILHNVTVECRKSIAAIADCYVTLYDIIYCNNYILRNKLVRLKLKVLWFVNLFFTILTSLATMKDLNITRMKRFLSIDTVQFDMLRCDV